MGESIGYIFESENYDELSSWVYPLFMIFILIPTAFLLYPLMLFYRWLFGTFEEFFLSIMLLFVSKKRKLNYYNPDKEENEEEV